MPAEKPKHCENLAFYKGMFSASKNYVAFYTVQGHGIHCPYHVCGQNIARQFGKLTVNQARSP
jgi:hypothetical protein